MTYAVSTGAVFSSTDAQREVWTNPTTIAPGTAVISVADQPGIAITGTGDYATPASTIGAYTITPAAGTGGGVGLTGKQVSVATDGTWEFPVTGGTTSTVQNTLVYAVVSSGDITSLTTTAGSNKVYGKVNYPVDYVKVDGTLPVKIGVFV